MVESVGVGIPYKMHWLHCSQLYCGVCLKDAILSMTGEGETNDEA